MKTFLNLGCGRCFHPTWTNADLHPVAPGILQVDARRGLPFPDAQFDVVYHSHTLEHVPRDEARSFLSEQRRVLRPGGTLRVVVPDLEGSARSYLGALEGALRGDPAARARYDWTMLELLDQVVRERSGGDMAPFLRSAGPEERAFITSRIGHQELEAAAVPEEPRRPVRRGLARLTSAARHPVSAMRMALVKLLLGRSRDLLEAARFRRAGEVHLWMYDRYSLARLIERAGFVDPSVMGASTSRIPGWASFQLDTTPDGAVRKPDSLFMEATRP